MGAGPKNTRARVRILAKGALAIRCLLKTGLSKTSGQFGIPEGFMPELEGISNSASLKLSGISCEMVPKQVWDGWHQHGIGILP